MGRARLRADDIDAPYRPGARALFPGVPAISLRRRIARIGLR
jgi:hypothetical protein